MNILEEIITYKNGSNPLKERYIAYIANQDISLEERWEVFCEAPIDWKNDNSYVVSFDVEKSLRKKGYELSWYDDFYIEKNETVIMQEIVERIKESLDEELKELGWSEELLNDFKNEILAKNLGSFDYDW